MMMKRRDWLVKATAAASSMALLWTLPTASQAFVVPSTTLVATSSSTTSSTALLETSSTTVSSTTDTTTATPKAADSSAATTALSNVLFQDLRLPVDDTNVPVACWWPSSSSSGDDSPAPSSSSTVATYPHRISVQRIGQLLAQWNFIPSFASKDFPLQPTAHTQFQVSSGQLLDAWHGPVVVLAHGYLGSRFDLSHLAETLAAHGFLCLAPEYPESLAASYERQPDLNRPRIQQALLARLNNNNNKGSNDDDTKEETNASWPSIQGTSFGIVGHSLGTGTALQTGNGKDWARVCLAGFPRQRDGSSIAGNVLLVCSLGDGAMNLQRFGGVSMMPSDFAILTDKDTTATAATPLPHKAAWILDGPTAPNHISFLSESVNDCMIDLLSPLLPVAQAANIPVLDFDKYATSRDAASTAATLHPVIVRYLKQEMKVV